MISFYASPEKNLYFSAEEILKFLKEQGGCFFHLISNAMSYAVVNIFSPRKKEAVAVIRNCST